jgi:hypothetical protein
MGFTILFVRGLSPPKPASLDPKKIRRHTPDWLRSVDSQKKIGNKNFTENRIVFFEK